MNNSKLKTSQAKSRKGNKKPISQKRFVVGIKVYVTEEEKVALTEKMEGFDSLSNYIRHHLGLTPNSGGRRRNSFQSALGDIEELLL